MDMADEDNHRLTAGFVEKYFAMWKNMENSQRYKYIFHDLHLIIAEMVSLQAHMLLVEGIGRNFGLRHLLFDLFSSQGVSPNSG